MPSVIQIHPRYAIATALGLLTVFLLLAAQHSGQLAPGPPPSHQRPPVQYEGSTGKGDTVASRLAESDRLYAINIARRNAFIRKTGPDPRNIQMFPPQGSGLLYTLWDYFLPAYQCPRPMTRVGTMGDGGKYVCGMQTIAKKKHCVVYSVGINGESSFEAELLQTSNCEVWGYDFSVDKFGPEIENDPELKPRAHFFPYMLTGIDDHNAKNPMWTLPSLMKKNGHKFIDILKIDIEGSEFQVLTDMLENYKDRPLPFGQLQLEIHAWGKSFSQFYQWFEALETAGLRPFMAEPNLVYLNLYRGHSPDLSEYAFLNIKGDHEVIRDD